MSEERVSQETGGGVGGMSVVVREDIPPGELWFISRGQLVVGKIVGIGPTAPPQEPTATSQD